MAALSNKPPHLFISRPVHPTHLFICPVIHHTCSSPGLSFNQTSADIKDNFLDIAPLDGALEKEFLSIFVIPKVWHLFPQQ